MKSNIAFLPAPQERAVAAEVDALGALEAKIERLAEQADVYRKKLKAALPTGNHRIIGRKFVATVYDGQAADKIDRLRLYGIVPRSRLVRLGVVKDGEAFRCLSVRPKKTALAAE